TQPHQGDGAAPRGEPATDAAGRSAVGRVPAPAGGASRPPAGTQPRSVLYQPTFYRSTSGQPAPSAGPQPPVPPAPAYPPPPPLQPFLPLPAPTSPPAAPPAPPDDKSKKRRRGRGRKASRVPPPAAATVPEQGGAAPADHPGTATEAAAPQPGFTIENGTMEPVGTGRQKVRARSSLSGGRWRRLLLQAGISVALLVLIVNGLFRLAGKALYDPPKPPVGGNYPAAGAPGYAVRFAAAYLTWDENKPGGRAKELELFLPSITDSQVGWDGKGAQAVRGQPVAAGVTARDDNHAVVHIAADLDPGGWTCMDVAVYAAPGGSAFAITSYAAFVACPPVTAAGVAPVRAPDRGRGGDQRRGPRSRAAADLAVTGTVTGTVARGVVGAVGAAIRFRFARADPDPVPLAPTAPSTHPRRNDMIIEAF